MILVVINEKQHIDGMSVAKMMNVGGEVVKQEREDHKLDIKNNLR